LLAYKTLEADETFDLRLAEFFIQGIFHTYKPVKLRSQFASKKKKPEGVVKKAMHTLGKLKRRAKKAKDRENAAPWVAPKTWALLDKLSKISPFN
jgi:hypothetical protein